ncbi:hypothetical protein ABT369_52970 [Dactylosporangium sp. NPDC000244]|uniref:hypothetical protein n=1 Tax=Dactylosporangium sp. NPDC000244 TaxID=3154365 RepID=UPI00331B9793
MTMRVTHVGGPTVLIEVGGWRLLTDPTFDPPGRRYTAPVRWLELGVPADVEA